MSSLFQGNSLFLVNLRENLNYLSNVTTNFIPFDAVISPNIFTVLVLWSFVFTVLSAIKLFINAIFPSKQLKHEISEAQRELFNLRVERKELIESSVGLRQKNQTLQSDVTAFKKEKLIQDGLQCRLQVR